MANACFLNQDDFVEVVFDGDQTAETIAQSVATAKELVQQLQSRHKKVLLLFNFTNVGKTNTAARKRALSAMEEFHFDKMAGFGASPMIRFISNTVARLSGKFEKTQHFKTRPEAEAWLKQQKSGA